MRTEAQREKPSPQIGSSCRASQSSLHEEWKKRGTRMQPPPPQPPVEEKNSSNRLDSLSEEISRPQDWEGFCCPEGEGSGRKVTPEVK